MEVAVVNEMLGVGAEGYVNPLSQTYGSDKDLAPAKRVEGSGFFGPFVLRGLF